MDQPNPIWPRLCKGAPSLEIYPVRHAQSTDQLLESREDSLFESRLTELDNKQAELPAEFSVVGEQRLRFC